jgi:hypothetical protein
MKDQKYMCGNEEPETNTTLQITSERECNDEPTCEQQDPIDNDQTGVATHGDNNR